MTKPQALVIQSEYQDVVQSLRALTNQHDKAFRMGIGKLLLDRFFGGRPAEFSSSAPNKPTTFNDFLQIHAEELAGLDLSEHQLRRCVRLHICHALLPPGVRDQLSWSALLQISVLPESNQRARLAAATVQQGWTTAEVRHAVDMARAQRDWDADPETPGLQLPKPAPAPLPQPGRLVNQTEKWPAQIAAWQGEFAKIDATKLSAGQRERLTAAVAAARRQLQELEARLAG